jgi:hypothetical protein
MSNKNTGAETVPAQPQSQTAPESVLVYAMRTGYYRLERHYPAGIGHARSGQPFRMFKDAFRKDASGNFVFDKNGDVVLPSWVKLVDDNAQVAEATRQERRTNRSAVNI